MERCPCCKARLGGARLCPRCQADLGNIIAAEQSARLWLSKAILHWQENAVEQCLAALERSLRLEKIQVALVFRDYLIHQQCRVILDLLAEKRLLPAKQQLYKVRILLPHSKYLQELQSFTDYLWINTQELRNSLPN